MNQLDKGTLFMIVHFNHPSFVLRSPKDNLHFLLGFETGRPGKEPTGDESEWSEEKRVRGV